MRRGLTGRMLVASGLLAVVVVAAFAVLLVAISNLRGATELSRQTRQELVAADGLEKLVIDLETGVRGFVITREERFLEPWHDARAALPETARVLERLAADDPIQLARVRRIVEALRTYIRQYTMPLVAAVRRNDASARSVETTAAGKLRVDALRSGFDRFREAGRARLNTREADANDAAFRATVAAAVGVAGSILLILVFTGYLTRVIVRPLRRAAVMADRLAGGDLSARMRDTDVAEIGALERSFNVMAGSLERSRDELASLVAEQAALRRVATLVAQGVRPAEVFSAVSGEVGRLFGADQSAVGRFEPEGDAIIVVGGAGQDSEGVPIATRWELDDSLATTAVFRTGRAARKDESDWSSASGPIPEALRRMGIRTTVASPIIVEGRLWGAMTVSTKREPLPPDAEERLANFTELVATAIANAESRAELAASRARIVSAADETRRRIERDLHDGTQQRLISLGLKLRVAQSDVPAALPELQRDIGRVANELHGVIDELREISRGIHPAILSEGGLGPALRTIARRSGIPVEVDLRTDARFPEQLEVATYYVVSEALTNAARHARASVVQVVLEERDGALQLAIRDDGVGGADDARGSGLIGLRDRVQALGGSIEVSSPSGEGTRVAVELPLQQQRQDQSLAATAPNESMSSR